jgi:hypothetical protein
MNLKFCTILLGVLVAAAATGGHAARAKELLREAGDEIKLAAIAANER